MTSAACWQRGKRDRVAGFWSTFAICHQGDCVHTAVGLLLDHMQPCVFTCVVALGLLGIVAAAPGGLGGYFMHNNVTYSTLDAVLLWKNPIKQELRVYTVFVN